MKSNIFSPIKHRYSLACNEISSDVDTILDVGGYVSRKSIINSFFQNATYKSLNIGNAWYVNEEIDYVYDGEIIPFKDKAFEYVICVDILEHIQSEKREKLINEMRRVSSKRTIIVTPFQKEGRKNAEAYIIDICDKNGIEPPPSLMEHELYGLPYLEELKSYLKDGEGKLKYATVFDDYWSMQIAMLWNTIAFEGNSEAINRRLKMFQEEYHSQQNYPICEDEAYRCVLIYDK